MEPNFPTHYREGHYYHDLYDLAEDIYQNNYDVEFDENWYTNLRAELLKDVYNVKPLEATNYFNNFWEDLDEGLELNEDAPSTLESLPSEIIKQVDDALKALVLAIPKSFCEPNNRITEEEADLIIKYVKEHVKDDKE